MRRKKGFFFYITKAREEVPRIITRVARDVFDERLNIKTIEIAISLGEEQVKVKQHVLVGCGGKQTGTPFEKKMCYNHTTEIP